MFILRFSTLGGVGIICVLGGVVLDGILEVLGFGFGVGVGLTFCGFWYFECFGVVVVEICCGGFWVL